MAPFAILVFVLLILGIVLCERNKESESIRMRNAVFLAVSGVILTLFAALRAKSVGIDYQMYEQYFNAMREGGAGFLFSGENQYRVEWGYSLLNYLVSLVSGDIRMFMAVAALLIMGLTCLFIAKNSPSWWLSIFVFVSFGFYTNSLCFIRQSIATAIFLFAIPFLKQKKLLPYLGIVVLAASFHKALFVMVVLYFIAHIPVNWKSLTAYGVLTALVLIFSWPIFHFVTQFVYQYYATEEGLYYMQGRDWQTAFVPVVYMLVIVGLRRYLLRRDEKNVVLVNFSIYAGLLYIMTCKHFLFQRFGMLFFTAAILVIPEFLASIDMDREALKALQENSVVKKVKNKQERKKAALEERQKRAALVNQKYYYRYSVAAVVFIGLVYYFWILLQDRTLLLPYLTFFQQ
ncbi:MAG TPA: EpsG family protein [Candidatus Caccousia avistercoris]|nr:EpsG family protein [Candidatus Caccousia avistercoris]